MKKMNNILISLYKISWIRWFLIPVTLFLLCLLFSLFLSSYANFTTLTHSYSSHNIAKFPKRELLKNESIIGEFKASDNNLGILAIRFNNPKYVIHDEEDVLIFRIKEKYQKRWLYQNTYRSGGIYGTPLYPFGFPQIVTSKGKIYQFSVTSLRGNIDNAVSLSEKEPVLISKYVYTKQQLFNDKKMLIDFICRKIINLFSDTDYRVALIGYMSPLIFYLF